MILINLGTHLNFFFLISLPKKNRDTFVQVNYCLTKLLAINTIIICFINRNKVQMKTKIYNRYILTIAKSIKFILLIIPSKLSFLICNNQHKFADILQIAFDL